MAWLKTQLRFKWLFPQQAVLDKRVIWLSALAIGVGVLAAFVAKVFLVVINFFTNLCFYGRISVRFASPMGHHLGIFVLAVPVLGGVVVGLMARYGSKAICGHGIPEAMEQVLLNQSRIPARVMWLKLVSSAVSIGTGGPFGAEGPIIATGGALGSIIGQALKTTADERKTILAAGAAAGMAATFGSPVSAAILAIELLLFEYHARSFIPVGLASVTAAGLRARLAIGAMPMFAMPVIAQPSFRAVGLYTVLGLLIGIAAVAVTKAVFWVEDSFEKLPVHWMWWPALGGIAVGAIGYFHPRTLGVGYDNIENILALHFPFKLLLSLCVFKFLSWVIALGSGTSGGTLAPLFTIGGALGGVLGVLFARALPHSGIDPGVAALVGMAAMFAGASRAVLASILFAFETTLQPMGLLPLMGGCIASYFVSCFLMPNSIMTEKIERRGVRVPLGYAMDFLSHALVKDYATFPAATLKGSDTAASARSRLESEPEKSRHAYPVVNDRNELAGVLTRREILDRNRPADQPLEKMVARAPVAVRADQSLREAVNRMLQADVGRLPVVNERNEVEGMISRQDILSAYRKGIAAAAQMEQTLFPAAR